MPAQAEPGQVGRRLHGTSRVATTGRVVAGGAPRRERRGRAKPSQMGKGPEGCLAWPGGLWPEAGPATNPASQGRGPDQVTSGQLQVVAATSLIDEAELPVPAPWLGRPRL